MKQAFYSDNEHRDYPFLNRPEPLSFEPDDGGPLNALPPAAVVDFAAIMFAQADFLDYVEHYVWLAAIERSGSRFRFRFRTTAPGAAGDDCVFTRYLTSSEFDNQWVVSGELTEGSSSIEGRAPTWEACLVTGMLDDIVEMLPHDGEILFARGLWRIEPARVQTLAGMELLTLNIANLPRTVVTPPDVCSSASEAPATEPIVVARDIVGDVRLVEGYNVSIRQEASNVGLIIGAGVGAGAGQTCGEVPRYPGETSPDGGAFLTGGPGCGEIITSINGIGGPDVGLVGGPGVTVQAANVPHTVIVAATGTNLALCPIPPSSDSSASL